MSRFISAGINDDEANRQTTHNDEAWLAAQRKIDATRLSRPSQPGAGLQEGGKSLYETLQANKAAKQEAFEESTRLRNQFRPLDADEIEFLDAVYESTRKREAEVQRETGEQVEAFRAKQRQDEAAAAAAAAAAKEGGDAGQGVDVLWSVGPRKRKKGVGGAVGGLKIRRTSTAATEEGEEKGAGAIKGTEDADSMPAVNISRGLRSVEGSGKSVMANAENEAEEQSPKDVTSAAKTTPPPPPVGLGLSLYSSDDDA